MKKNTKYLLIGVAVLSLIFVVTYGATYAKYTSDSLWNYYLRSRGFYFSSDELNTNNYINNNWDGGSTTFTIKNYISDSQISEYDINYEVTCNVVGDAASYSKCQVNGVDSNKYTGVLTGGVGKTTKDIYFDITKTSTKELTGVNVEITVTSTAPFKKTLKNTFILNKGTSELGFLDVSYNDFNTYQRVVVTNSYDEDKCVKLSWNPSDLRIDIDKSSVSNILTDNDGYINEISFNIEKNNSISYIFYKTSNSLKLDKNAFNISQSKNC